MHLEPESEEEEAREPPPPPPATLPPPPPARTHLGENHNQQTDTKHPGDHHRKAANIPAADDQETKAPKKEPHTNDTMYPPEKRGTDHQDTRIGNTTTGKQKGLTRLTEPPGKMRKDETTEETTAPQTAADPPPQRDPGEENVPVTNKKSSHQSHPGQNWIQIGNNKLSKQEESIICVVS